MALRFAWSMQKRPLQSGGGQLSVAPVWLDASGTSGRLSTPSCNVVRLLHRRIRKVAGEGVRALRVAGGQMGVQVVACTGRSEMLEMVLEIPLFGDKRVRP